MPDAILAKEGLTASAYALKTTGGALTVHLFTDAVAPAFDADLSLLAAPTFGGYSPQTAAPGDVAWDGGAVAAELPYASVSFVKTSGAGMETVTGWWASIAGDGGQKFFTFGMLDPPVVFANVGDELDLLIDVSMLQG